MDYGKITHRLLNLVVSLCKKVFPELLASTLLPVPENVLLFLARVCPEIFERRN